MLDTWKTYKLQELGEIVGGGTPSTRIVEYFRGDIPWLTPKDLTGYNFKFIKKGARNISVLGMNSCGAKILPPGTVLMSSRAPIGYLVINENDLTTNQGFKSVICNKKLLNNQFLYYFLKNNINKLHSIATGSTFLEISGSALKNFEIHLPPLPEQQAIAEILSALDDKIELNLQINKTLDDTANTLYKHWLVDFGPFRNEKFVESELGLIPEGWEVKSLAQIATIKGGKRLDKKFQLQKAPNSHPYVRIKDFNSVYLNKINMEFVPDDAFNQISKYIVSTDDVLLTIVGTIGAVALVGEDLNNASLTENCVKITPKNYNISSEYIFLKLVSFEGQNEIKAKTIGSTQPKLPIYNINSLQFVLPTETSILQKFQTTVKQLFKLIFQNTIEIGTLIKTRNYLLPKLVSGEISVKEAQKKIKELI